MFYVPQEALLLKCFKMRVNYENLLSMKKLNYLGSLFCLCCLSIHAQVPNKKAKTYAEISIKEGGKWEDRKYIGGTFKNVKKVNLAPQHTDHSFDIRYEGPGWESNKIAYRLYLDWRNAIDIFGKKTESIILPGVGQDGFDSYHEMSDWGSDILKAGKGIGIGSVDRYVNNQRLHFYEVDATTAEVFNTKSASGVVIKYQGWKTNADKINLTSKLSIAADQRHTKHTITSSIAIEGLCTGIVKQKNTAIFKAESTNKKWAYLATYGKQSLVPDNLGMGIFYEISTVDSEVDAEFDHLLLFKPSTKPITFYFFGAWEQEKEGIKTKEAFEEYLNNQLNKLNNTGQL